VHRDVQDAVEHRTDHNANADRGDALFRVALIVMFADMLDCVEDVTSSRIPVLVSVPNYADLVRDVILFVKWHRCSPFCVELDFVAVEALSIG
jgi:hypothetical protein